MILQEFQRHRFLRGGWRSDERDFVGAVNLLFEIGSGFTGDALGEILRFRPREFAVEER